MNLEDVMLSEISETQKYKYCVTDSIYARHPKWSNSQKGEQWLPGAEGRDG